MDLTEPDIDYTQLAGGFGVLARRVVEIEQIAPAVKAALASGGPYLIEVLTGNA